jgi:hypothetical protein
MWQRRGRKGGEKKDAAAAAADQCGAERRRAAALSAFMGSWLAATAADAAPAAAAAAAIIRKAAAGWAGRKGFVCFAAWGIRKASGTRLARDNGVTDKTSSFSLAYFFLLFQWISLNSSMYHFYKILFSEILVFVIRSDNFILTPSNI